MMDAQSKMTLITLIRLSHCKCLLFEGHQQVSEGDCRCTARVVPEDSAWTGHDYIGNRNLGVSLAYPCGWDW